MDDLDAFEKELMAIASPSKDFGSSGDGATPGGDLIDFLGASSTTPVAPKDGAATTVNSDDDLLAFLESTTPNHSGKNVIPVISPPVMTEKEGMVTDNSSVETVRSKVSSEVVNELQTGVIMEALDELEGETKGDQGLETSLLDGTVETGSTQQEGQIDVESDARTEGDFTIWHRESETPHSAKKLSRADLAPLHPCSYAGINKNFFGAYGPSVSGASSASYSGDRVQAWSQDDYYVSAVVEVVVRPDVTLENLVSAAAAVGKQLRLPMARPQVDQLLLLGNRRRIDDERDEARQKVIETSPARLKKGEAESGEQEVGNDKPGASQVGDSVPPARSIRDLPPEDESGAGAELGEERDSDLVPPALEAVQTGLFSSSVIAGANLNEGLSNFATGVKMWGGALFSPGTGADADNSASKTDGIPASSSSSSSGDSSGGAARSTSVESEAGAAPTQSFLGINISSVASALLGLEDEQNSIYSAKNRREWNADYDLLDVRVCVSKELNQRVMLTQFLKRTDGGGEGSGALGTGAGEAHSPSSKSRALLQDKPHVASFVAQLKAGMLARRLLLSSLYTETVEKVCSLDSRAFGLCDHYYLQLSALYHSNTLLRLKQPLVAMSEWALKAERATACVVTMLRVMVEREHGLAMPPYVAPELPPQSQEGREEESIDPLGVLPPRTTGSRSGGGEKKSDEGAGTRGRQEQQEEEEEEEEEEGGSITLVQLFDKRAREAAKSKGGAQRRVGSISTSEAILQQPHYSSEGLAKCLLAMNSLTDSVIKHCDKVATVRVDGKNAEIVRLLGALTGYKLSIVQTMVHSAEASQTSAVGLSFLRLFKDARVSLPLPPSAAPRRGGGVSFAKYPGGSAQHPTPGDGASSTSSSSGADVVEAPSEETGAGLLGWASSILSPSTGILGSSAATMMLPGASETLSSPPPAGGGGGGADLKGTKAALMANRLQELRGLRRQAESASRGAKDREEESKIKNTQEATLASTPIRGAGTDTEPAALSESPAAVGLAFRWTEAVVLYYCNVLVDCSDSPDSEALAGARVRGPPSTAATLYITQQHLCLYLGIPALAVGLQGLTDSLASSISTLTPTKTALLGGADASTPASGDSILPVSGQGPAQGQGGDNSVAQPVPVPVPSTGGESTDSMRLVFPLSKIYKTSVQRASNVLGVETNVVHASFYEGNRSVTIRPLVEEAERLRLLLSELTEISAVLSSP